MVAPAAVAAAAVATVERQVATLNNRTKLMHRLTARAIATLFGCAILVSAPIRAQQAYPTPDAASEAFVDALARHDGDALKVVVGPRYRDYIPSLAADSDSITDFLAAWANSRKTVVTGDTAMLEVGKNAWQLPIPLHKSAEGWRFNIGETADLLRTRRIGRNELDVMQTLLAYYDAQKDYALADHDGDDVLQYATRLLSSPGKQDGLYWAAKPGEPESPAGPRFSNAQRGSSYHGYHYKILTAQGKNADGGAFDYVIGKRMTGGFAAIAWPAKYGDTGVMTFMVNYKGTVYQKDLGPNSAALAKAITRFDPDASWAKVSP